MTRVAIVYYSSTGHVHQLARAVQAGAKEAGAEVPPVTRRRPISTSPQP